MVWHHYYSKTSPKYFRPKSTDYKILEKIKKNREKIEQKKEKYLLDQIHYIESMWGYTDTQSKVIEKAIEDKGYLACYDTLSAALLPQVIVLIDICNEKGKKGCQREVSKRIKEFVTLLKEQTQQKRNKENEVFEITLDVYDQLLKELSK